MTRSASDTDEFGSHLRIVLYHLNRFYVFSQIFLIILGKTLVDSTDTQVIRSRYKNLGQFDVMYIMAELEEEVILAIIKYRVTDGLLLVYPDFNDIDHNPYIREIDADSRHIYQFCIENLSDERRQPDWSLKQDLDKLASKVCFIYNSKKYVITVYCPHSKTKCFLTSQ